MNTIKRRQLAQTPGSVRGGRRPATFRLIGRLPERPNGAVLKTVEVRASLGSNPRPPAGWSRATNATWRADREVTCPVGNRWPVSQLQGFESLALCGPESGSAKVAQFGSDLTVSGVDTYMASEKSTLMWSGACGWNSSPRLETLLASVAQRTERRPSNPGVAGSIPAGGTASTSSTSWTQGFKLVRMFANPASACSRSRG